jgi:RES domain-containing protein
VTPRLTALRQNDTHRLIPSKYSENGASVLARLTSDEKMLAAIFDLDHATNERLLAENERQPGIARDELLGPSPCFRIVNAAFTHAHPLGSRFNGPDRGAWYAAFELEGAQAEVAWHKSVELEEIGYFTDSMSYDSYLADFSAAFHDIRNDAAFARCLDPNDYRESQLLAETLVEAGSAGIVYPSVRHPAGTCLSCFRPGLVTHVRKHARYRFSWSGAPVPEIALEVSY